MWFKLNICFTTISDLEQPDVCIALAVYSGNCSNVLYWVYFCFLRYIILKQDGSNIKCEQTFCHFGKPILKILSIYRKNILGKQLSQAICFKYVFRLPHALESLIFSSKLNMMVKVVKLFTDVLWESCSDEFYRKTSMQESLF